ncbi:MAG: class I SAM-dependent methyltransferase [Christensenellaceae bacterium]|nr:class I SAM-dependent methyltransferase [Christensenellaceae bacterium]
MENNAEFWDRVAKVYNVFVNVINAKTHKNLRNQIIPYFNNCDTVLECACGTGMLTEAIAPICKKLIATDFSKKMLLKANQKCKNHKNICFMVADILHLDFADGSFDKVIAANVIHLLHNPTQALIELERVCRPGGKIIIPTYINKKSNNKENKFVRLIGKMGVKFKERFTFSEYCQFIRDAGYPHAKYINVDGFIPCSIAVIDKK